MTFGDIDKFQLKQSLKRRLKGAVHSAYAWALLNDQDLGNVLLKFTGLINPIEQRDDSILPGGNLVHPIHRDTAADPVKTACLQVLIRTIIAEWWEYASKDKTTKDEDAVIAGSIGGLIRTIKHYADLKVVGDIREGYKLDTE